jgi:hypothetical protein
MQRAVRNSDLAMVARWYAIHRCRHWAVEFTRSEPDGISAEHSHAKVDTTLNVYTQVVDGALRAAVDKVGAELFTIVHKPAGSPELIR